MVDDEDSCDMYVHNQTIAKDQGIANRCVDPIENNGRTKGRVYEKSAMTMIQL